MKKYVAVIVVMAVLMAMPVYVNGGHRENPSVDEGVRALTPHDPINIDGDASFDSQAASEGWAGSGTRDDPYIIEGYSITTEDSTVPVQIVNTTRAFVLRNCSIYFKASSDAPYGVRLYNITYAWINNITISSDSDSSEFYIGIFAVDYDNLEIYNSTIAGDTMNGGIYLSSSSGSWTEVVGNYIESFGGVNFITPYGIEAYTVQGVIYDNTVITWGTGMFLRDTYLTVAHNTLKSPYGEDGIGFYVLSSVSSSPTIRNNLIEDFNKGIYAYQAGTSGSLGIIENTIRNATKGIEIKDTSLIYVIYNTIVNTENAIEIEGTDPNLPISGQVGGNIITNASEIAIYIDVVALKRYSTLIISGNSMDSGGIFVVRGTDLDKLVMFDNLINNRSVFYLKNIDMNDPDLPVSSIPIPVNTAQVILYNVSNYEIKNLNLDEHLAADIQLFNVDNITIRDCVSKNSDEGIHIVESQRLNIFHNYINSSSRVIYEFNSYAMIYENYFVGEAYVTGYNVWTNPEGTKGNYWYEWAQTHNDTDGDGIIDDPKLVPLLDMDPLPLAYSPFIKAPDSPQLTVNSGDSYAHLSWIPGDDGGDEISEYRIYRGTDVNSISLLTTLDGKTTEYNDTSVENGMRYYYYVTAVNSAGEGEKSNIVESTPLGLPGAPLSLTYTLDGNRITLTWTPPSDNGGSEIREYRVYRNGEVIFRAAPGQTSYSETLEYGVQYSYYITAVNSAGEGEMSETISVRPVSVPDAPMDLLAHVDNGTLHLSWRAPADNGEPIMEYRVYRNGTLVATTDNETTEITFTSDVSGSYYVTAVNSLGESEASNPVYVSYQVVKAPSEEPEENNTENPNNETPTNQTPVQVIVQPQGNSWVAAAVALEIGILGLVAYQVIGGRRREAKEDKEENV